MRNSFPGNFIPTEEEFAKLWDEGKFCIDANILLNLYRYTTPTKKALEDSLDYVSDKLIITHHAAKEFFRNRLGVTSGQAEEYQKALKQIDNLYSILINKTKHPCVEGEIVQNLNELRPQLEAQLNEKYKTLVSRLNNDEILIYIENLLKGKVVSQFDEAKIQLLSTEGDQRYQKEIPPGYKDGKKDNSGDPLRKYGDLIIWKQLIEYAKNESKPIVFITDDRKEDWWLEQNGKKIGPRPELIEEFRNDTKQLFWMYPVERFVEKAFEALNTPVSKEAIEEIIETSNENTAFRESSNICQDQAVNSENQCADFESDCISNKYMHPVLQEDEILIELQSFLESHPSEDGGVGLKYFVVNYLGSQDIEINHSYAKINALADQGRIQIYKKPGSNITRIKI